MLRVSGLLYLPLPVSDHLNKNVLSDEWIAFSYPWHPITDLLTFFLLRESEAEIQEPEQTWEIEMRKINKFSGLLTSGSATEAWSSRTNFTHDCSVSQTKQRTWIRLAGSLFTSFIFLPNVSRRSNLPMHLESGIAQPWHLPTSNSNCIEAVQRPLTHCSLGRAVTTSNSSHWQLPNVREYLGTAKRWTQLGGRSESFNDQGGRAISHPRKALMNMNEQSPSSR